jgi:hypothetical protein
MKNKFIVRLTEQDLVDLIKKQLPGNNIKITNPFAAEATPDVDPNIKSDNTNKKIKSNDINKSLDDKPNGEGKNVKDLSKLDLNTRKGYKAYETIADTFISSRSSNILGIRGSMLADAAKNTYNQYGSYVPPELALAQLAVEGGFSTDPNAKPIRTKNPFNVGNIDKGSTITHNSVQGGIQAYYDLMGRSYLSKGKTTSDLLSNFVNKNGNRYATNPNYESSLKQIAGQAQRMSEPVYASLGIKSDENIA